MSNVQEALKAAQKVICEGIYSDDGMDGEDGQKALLAIDAALSEIGKCEPVAWRLTHHDGSYEIVTRESWQNVRKSEPLYTSPQPRDWVELSDNFIAETIWENTKLNPNIKDDAETLLYVTNAVKAINDELKQLNTKG